MKSKRHLKILNLIKKEDIGTQQELVARLHEAGIEVTQATVSRDIKKLGLIKVPDGHGGYKYSLSSKRSKGDVQDWMKKMIQDFVVEMNYSENIIVLKTLLGTASGLGAAIDNSKWEKILGTVAGDDTILLVVKDRKYTEEVFNKIKELLG
ncbi:MAG TPA: arginine repressor [Halanaerobiales bacterium]|nr:arginine repressor [Halanaerobiales bacterium]